MRRQDHILHPNQRMVQGQRLRFDHVQACTRNGPCLQRGHQILLVDDRAASRIDEIGARLHHLEQTAVYESPRLLGQGTVGNHEIRIPENGLQAHEFHVQRIRPLRVQVRIVGKAPPQVERTEKPEHLAPDIAHPHRAYRLAAKSEPGSLRLKIPSAGPHQFILRPQLFGQGQDQRQDRLRHRLPNRVHRNSQQNVIGRHCLRVDEVIANPPARKTGKLPVPCNR